MKIFLALLLYSSCFASTVTASKEFLMDTHCAIDSSGHSIAIWRGISRSGVQISSSDDGGKGWNSPIELDKREKDSVAFNFLKVAFDQAGAAVAIWARYDYESNIQDLLISKSLDYGRTWGQPQSLASRDHISQVSLLSPFVFCQTDRGVEIFRSEKDGKWTSILMEPPTPCVGAAFAFHRNGGMVVAFLSDNLIIKTSANFGEDFSETMIDAGLTYQINAAIGASGNALITWEDGKDAIYFTNSLDGTSWSSFKPLSPSGLSSANSKLLFSSDGHGLVFWNSYQDHAYDIFTTSSPNGGKEWSSTTNVSKEGLNKSLFQRSHEILGQNPDLENELTSLDVSEFENFGSGPKDMRDLKNGLVQPFPKEIGDNHSASGQMVDSGETILIWSQRGDKYYQVKTALSLDYGQNFSFFNTIFDNGRESPNPTLAISDNGNGVALWMKKKHGVYYLQTATTKDFGKTWQK